MRATHEFLAEEEITRLKPLVLNNYFKMVALRGYKNEAGRLIGFIGVDQEKIEMLFVHPVAQGQGVGSSLCRNALEQDKVSLVDVNEQNPRAKKFYEKMGFKVKSRSEVDGEGKPYPILHMTL